MKTLNKKKIVTYLICGLFIICSSFLLSLFTNKINANAIYNTSATSILRIGTSSTDDILVSGYTSKTKKFDGDKLDKLYNALTGTTGATLTTITNKISTTGTLRGGSSGSRIVTGSQIYTNAGNKNIVLTFGGKEWTVTALTTNRSGDPIATLWLANSTATSKFSYFTSASGQNTLTGSYPADMYATSYVRVVTLNAGGSYAKTNSALQSSSQSSSNTWAKFTMPSATGSVTSFIDTPANIAYQETESFAELVSTASIIPNDAYGTSSAGSWAGTQYNYNNLTNAKTYYNNWKNDYIWLPSLPEIGRHKYYNIESSQINTSSPVVVGFFAPTADQAVNSTKTMSNWAWTRSGTSAQYGIVPCTSSDGTTTYSSNNIASSTLTVRPCLHLNLKKVEASSVRAVTMPSSQTYTYQEGQERRFSSLSGYDSKKMSIGSAVDGHTDAGTYTATITLNDGYYVSGSSTDTTTKTVTITINKKSVNTPSNLSISYDNLPHKPETIASWYQSQYMTLVYTADTEDGFVAKGTYDIKVKLKNVNYCFGSDTTSTEKTITFEITGIKVDPSGFTKTYTGEDFKTLIKSQTWFDSKYMLVDKYDELEFINAGSYNFVVKLTDNNVSFAGSLASVRENTYTVVITKKNIALQTLNITEEGIFEEEADFTYADVDPIAERDLTEENSNKRPNFALEYKKVGASDVWSRIVPTMAGKYEVRAVITNPDTCNYQFNPSNPHANGNTTFEKKKVKVALPYLISAEVDPEDAVKITSTQYSGSSQSFKLVNNSDHESLDNVVIVTCSGGIKYFSDTKTFEAKAVGVYCITVCLADCGNNTEWAQSNLTNVEQNIEFTITKKELVAKVLDSDSNKWESGAKVKLQLEVTGINNDEDVQLEVWYTKNGTEETYITEFSSSDNVILVDIDITSFEAEKNYALFVQLDDSISVNKNYTLTNENPKVYEFFILTASIKDINIEWLYSNEIIGTNQIVSSGYIVNTTTKVGESAGFEVEYNGKNFEVKLNQTLLPTGIESATYVNDTCLNANSYTTTVTLTIKSGYELASGVPKVFSINWKIKPQEYDLKTLVWQEDKFYQPGVKQIIGFVDLPTFITANTTSAQVEIVGDYTTTYDLIINDDNYIFALVEGIEWIRMDASDLYSATVTHNWKIKKQVITVSNANKAWSKVETAGKDGKKYLRPVPIGLDEFLNNNIVKLTYTDAISSNEVNISNIEVEDGVLVKYNAIITLNPDYADRYEIYNDIQNGKSYASTTFFVGDNRTQITLTYNYSETTGAEYTGGNIIIEPTCSSIPNIEFNVKYYKQGMGGEIEYADSVYPVEVGTYRVEVEDVNNEYNILNRVFWLEVTPLILETDAWEPKGGNLKPQEHVRANIEEIEDFYKYEIYDVDGNLVDDPDNLSYHKKYVAKLSVTNSNVKFADEAKTEFEFRTELDTSTFYTEIEIPILEEAELVWTGENITFVISNWENIKDYVEIKKGSLTQKDVGYYYVTITLKSDLDVIWRGYNTLSDDATDDETEGSKLKDDEFVLQIKINPLIIERPTITNAIYNGEAQSAYNFLMPSGNWALWLEEVEGSTSATQTNIGRFELKLKIKDDCAGGIIWDEVTSGGDELLLEWKILPAQIVGSWVTSGKYPTISLVDESQKDLFTIKYYKLSGETEIEVKPSELVEGQTYLCKLNLLNDNYEFCIDSEVLTPEQQIKEFTYTEDASLLDKVIEFVKENYLMLAIALGVLFFLLLIIIIAKRHKKKKEEKKLEKEAKQNRYEKDDETARLKAEIDKLELERKLAEIKSSSQPQFSAYPPQYPQYAPPPQMFPPNYYQQPDAITDRRMAEDIKDLKESVMKLTKYQLASEEEKSQNSRLAKVENMLMQFLMNNFSNNPNWVPFNGQDMVNYDINDLMKVYSQAKALAQNNAVNFNQNAKKQLQTEAEGFENKVMEYQKQKEDSQYVELLKEMREKINNIEKSLEDNQKLSLHNELEKTKQELLKKESELAKKDAEVENLKEKAEKVEKEPAKEVSEVRVPEKPQPEKLSFDDAFDTLPANQKRYFNEIKEYALKQPNAKSKPAKQHFSIGMGNSVYVKFVIKYSTLIAVLGTTEVKLENDSSVEIAKQMIDTRVKKFQDKV